MRIVLAGAGRAGLSVAAHLRSAGHDVILLDMDADLVRRAAEQHGLVTLAGDATDPSLLEEAEVSRADVVVALLRRDADNLAVAQLAQAAGVARVMVRMRDPAYRRLYDRAGVVRVLSEIEILVGALATAVEHDAVRHAMVLAGGESIAFEIALEPGAWVAGRTVSDVASHRSFPASCVIAGLHVPGEPVRAPRGSSVLVAGERLLLACGRVDLSATVSFFSSHPEP